MRHYRQDSSISRLLAPRLHTGPMTCRARLADNGSFVLAKLIVRKAPDAA